MLRKINQSWAARRQSSIGILFSISSGLLLALVFNNGKLWILAWFAFVPLFLALDNKSLRQAFLLFFIAGIVFWSSTIYWLANVTLAGTALLVLYLALYFAIFGLIIRPFTRHSRACILLFIPSLWVLLEYARSHLLTGFPWALLGYSQYLNLPVIQIADITGVWGVSFLVMFVNVAIVEMFSSFKARLWPRLAVIAISVALSFSWILAYAYFYLSLNPAPSSQHPIRICVVQGNIPQKLKWDIAARSFVVHRYLELTKEALKDPPSLIIWPEAALPVVPEEESEYFREVVAYVKEIKKPLVFGAVTLRQGNYYNSALLLSREGELVQKYDKIHLVPFGEYIPLRDLFSFLESLAPIGDITAGKDYTVFRVNDGYMSQLPFSVLICFEDLFPELSRKFVGKGARLLVNITNDAWFGKTSSPYQHLSASVFRAVENRVYLLRSANTGISGFIRPDGRIISFIEDGNGNNIFIQGYGTKEIYPPGRIPSLYTLYGDVFIRACFLLFCIYIIASFNRKK